MIQPPWTNSSIGDWPITNAKGRFSCIGLRKLKGGKGAEQKRPRVNSRSFPRNAGSDPRWVSFRKMDTKSPRVHRAVTKTPRVDWRRPGPSIDCAGAAVGKNPVRPTEKFRLHEPRPNAASTTRSRPYRLARSGHVPFTDVTGVRIPVGTPIFSFFRKEIHFRSS